MEESGGGCVPSDADFAAEYDVQEILGEQFTRGLEFLELKAIEIDRCHTQTALKLTEATRKVMLPGNLQYVRMCKAIDQQRLLLIYGRDSEVPFRSEFESQGIQIYGERTVKVPRYSPSTLEQYHQWSKHWPLKYLKPSVTPVKITKSLKDKILSMIEATLIESRNNQDKAVCIITHNDRIIAKAVDERDTNILNHAALLAVRKVAQLQKNDPKRMSNAKRRFTGSHNGSGNAEASVAEEPTDDVEIPDYLCTQCEVYMSHEPCFVYATGDKLKLKFPQLFVTWEILDYDAPAALQVEFLDGRKRRIKAITQRLTMAEANEESANDNVSQTTPVVPPLEAEGASVAVGHQEIDLTTLNEPEPESERNESEPVTTELPNQGSRYFNTHIAVLYDAFSNFKDRASNRFKERVMTFMRHENIINATTNANSSSETRRDVEGGEVRRASDVTYDSLIFKITVVLGFVLQFPVLWIAGSFLFIATSNLKASTIKWGCVNIFLSIISIMYMVQQWQLRSSKYMYSVAEETIIFESNRMPQRWESSIAEKDHLRLLKEFHALKDQGGYSSVKLGDDKNLVNPDNAKDSHSIYIATGLEVDVNGWIQFGAILSNDSKSPRSEGLLMRIGAPGKYPVAFQPYDTPIFDIGLKCTNAKGKVVWIGANASKANKKGIESDVFYLNGTHSCLLAYTITGSRPLVHKAYIKTL
ncbi:conserved plasmodium [Babesia ovata]|uniref:Conserved plasmodium n=1 Tax=Babesia ovata TaxID=189622 RepID=A0A2H6KHR1_9APIC|nr:conserved plasmodium [Babesia ovata]GBE62509.1 conserved plasmodium [Babesia ovata]